MKYKFLIWIIAALVLISPLVKAGCTGTASYTMPTGTESCSSFYSVTYPCANSHDGNTGTGWFSQGISNEWIWFDLGVAKCISGVQVYPWSGYNNQVADILVSDDASTWTTAYTSWTIPTGGAWNTQAFTEVSGRYIMLNFTSLTTYASVAEFTANIRNYDAGGPTITSVSLDSTTANNFSGEDLIISLEGVSDPQNDPITNTTNWYADGNSITVLNLAFDTNSSTTVKDYSGDSNDAILGNGTAQSKPTWISSGILGGAYDFDGVDDRMLLVNNEELNSTSGNISIEVWLNVEGLGTIDQTIIEKCKPNTFQRGKDCMYNMYLDSGGNITFRRPQYTTGVMGYVTMLKTSSAISTGSWHHIVAV